MNEFELARSYDDPAPIMVAATTLAVRLAKQIDDAVLAVLQRRGLTLDEARPRLSRQVLGGTERILLDGEPIVDVGPLRTAWSEDGQTVMAGRAVREVAPGEICWNCDTALPGGCGGLFADDGKHCRWKP